MQSKQLSAVVLLTLLIIKSTVTAAAPAVKIYSLEESGDSKLSQPRIYIENLPSSVPISNFYYYYYFTVENGKTPAPLEDYYTPNSIPTLESLGNGNYRIKYTFLGVTIQPGEILPNTSGNVIGIQYTDWSEMDKTNDHSNNLSSTFALNPNIPAFLADGTPINGNPPPDPGNPPEPPQITGSIGDFAVFSEECTDLRDRVKIIAGNVGSLIYTELGCDDTLYGDVLSGGSIFLRERARIYGNVTSGQLITEQNGVYVEDIKRSFAQLELPELQTPVITYGSLSISVSPNDSYTLLPGMYDSFHAYANAKITIQPGEYSFREFILEPNDTILLNVDHGDRIDLNVKDHCSLGNGTFMTFPDGINLPYALNIHSSQTTQLYIGTETVIKGLIYAPDAEVHVYSRTEISGSVYGRRVVVEPEVTFCKPPTLLNLSHSEGAMAPPFDPLVFDYIAVVPDATATIIVTPVLQAGQTVTVNGNTPATPIELPQTENDITMLLTHPEACGITEYTLKVLKSANYQIYVDQNSPCTPGSEDGQTWLTAYKDLQDALDDAMNSGKEIWVHEGNYFPSRRIDPSDPKSATFRIFSGIEIKGGFIGTESDDTPLGSLYNTIISGDINSDDINFTWPPEAINSIYVTDNVYHVITIEGNAAGKDISISNVTITHGYADGNDVDASGAGIMLCSGNPHFEFVGIVDNYSYSAGAGIYVAETGGLDNLKNVLFKGLVSQNGSGAGLYYESADPLKIDASVFDLNMSETGGSAIYLKGTNTELINCVIARNNSNSNFGAIVNDEGSLTVLNCTFGYNNGSGAVSISNANTGNTEIRNSILWNSNNKTEVNGDNYTISYSCLTKDANAFPGSNNISSDPLMRDPGQLAGGNEKWGDFDDGMQLAHASPCINSASDQAPEVDILLTSRPTGDGCDMGAYEFFVTENIDGFFGIKYGDNQFLPSNDIIIYEPFKDVFLKKLAPSSKNARHLRAFIPDNKYTNSKNTLKVIVWVTDGSNILADVNSVEMTIERIGIENGAFVYYSTKPILFFNDKDYVNYYAATDTEEAYYLFGSDEGIAYRFVLPSSQF